jgi:hypothetical protein
MSGEPLQLDLLAWLAAQAPGPAPAMSSFEIGPAPADTGPVLLTRVDPSCNMRRFYSVALATSLFGETGVVRHWGGSGARARAGRTGMRGRGRPRQPARGCLLRSDGGITCLWRGRDRARPTGAPKQTRSPGALSCCAAAISPPTPFNCHRCHLCCTAAWTRDEPSSDDPA